MKRRKPFINDRIYVRRKQQQRTNIIRAAIVLGLSLAITVIFAEPVHGDPTITQVEITPKNEHLPIPEDKPPVKRKFWPQERVVIADRVSVIAKEAGYTDSMVSALLELLMRESGINPNAVNKSSGACGLFQRLPCSVTLGDVEEQMENGLAYIKQRYGTPERALRFQIAHNWY